MGRWSLGCFVLLALFAASAHQGQAPPQGAVARCGNGQYVYVSTGSKTCKGYGGVAEWLNEQPSERRASESSTVQTTAAADESVVVITGVGFSGLYHRPDCPVLKSAGGLVTITRAEAEGRSFRPHEECLRSGQPANRAPALAPASSATSAPRAVAPKQPAPATQPGRCQAITRAGTQCKRRAQPGSIYCWQHAK